METVTSIYVQCQICSSIPKNPNVLYVHYGATCCFNCKQFFLRYARGDTEVPKKKCDLNCDIRNQGRSVCKICRYAKCLKVGMDPKRILNEEERKKYRHPKKKNQSTSSTSESSQQSTNQLQESTEHSSLIPINVQCQICSSIPKNPNVLYVHYGATCCFNCKRFFLRYARGDTELPKKKCDLNCDIRNPGRSVCKICRYAKCLKVGMDPKRILDEEERKKYSHPKKKNQSTSSTSESSQPTNQLQESTEHSSENSSLIPIVPTLTEQLQLSPDESIWISKIKDLYFKTICKTITYEDNFIKRFVTCFMGKTPEIRDTLIMESASINKSRFQSLLIHGLNLDLKEINPNNYGLCILAFVAKSDSYPSIRHYLHFCTQNDDLDYFTELDKLDNIPKQGSEKLCNAEIVADLYPSQKMKMLMNKVGEFLMNTEVYVLVKLFILTFGSANFKVQSWNRSIKRLLLKQLRHLCGTNDVEEYLDTFSNQFLECYMLSEKVRQFAYQE